METFKVRFQVAIGTIYLLFLIILFTSSQSIIESIQEQKDFVKTKATFYKVDNYSSGRKSGRSYFLDGFINTKFNNRIEVNISSNESERYEALMGSEKDDMGEPIKKKRVTQSVWYNPNNNDAELVQSNDKWNDLVYERGYLQTLKFFLILLISLCLLYGIIMCVGSNQTLISLFKESYSFIILAKFINYFFTFIAFLGFMNNITESNLGINSLDKLIEVKAQITQVSELTEDSQYDNYSYTIKGVNLIDNQAFNYIIKNNQDIYFMFKGDIPERVARYFEPKPSIPEFYHENQKVYCHFWYNPVTQKVLMSQTKPTISSLRLDWLIKFDSVFFIIGFLIILKDIVWFMSQLLKDPASVLNLDN